MSNSVYHLLLQAQYAITHLVLTVRVTHRATQLILADNVFVQYTPPHKEYDAPPGYNHGQWSSLHLTLSSNTPVFTGLQ